MIQSNGFDLALSIVQIASGGAIDGFTVTTDLGSVM